MRFSDFTIEKSFTSTNGDCFIAISNIDKKKYFIKRSVDVTYGNDNDPPELRKKYKKDADEWINYHRKIRQALTKLGNGTGNIVFPVNYFVDDGRVYEVACFVNISAISLNEIKSLGEKEKLQIMQTSSFALKSIHSIGIIHFDLKPENIPISKSEMGGYISKITDCSDALFNTFQDDINRPPQEQIVCTDSYWSPELALYKLGQKEAGKLISSKNDVFAMGLIFHEWWTGKFPNYEGRDDFVSPYQVFSNIWPSGIKIDLSVPDWLAILIMDMLCPNPEYRPDMNTVFEAIKSKSYTSSLQKQSKKKTASTVDLTPIKNAYQRIPKKLDKYTDESVDNLNELIAFIKENMKKISSKESAEKIAIKLNLLIDSLEEKPQQISLSKIDNAISAIKSKDLSRFSKESVDNLKKVVRIASEQRNRIIDESTLNKVYNALVNAYKSLVIRNDFPVDVVNPLPSPYTKVDIISENEIVAHYGANGKIKLSVDNAVKMKLVTRK